MNLWKRIRVYLAGAFALVICPCHLPLTFPLLLALTAGTTLGFWLQGKFWLIFSISTAIFIGSLSLWYLWNTQDKTSSNQICKPSHVKGDTQS